MCRSRRVPVLEVLQFETIFYKLFPQKMLTAHSDIYVLLFCTIYTAYHKQTNKQANNKADDDDFIPTGLSIWTNRRVIQITDNNIIK